MRHPAVPTPNKCNRVHTVPFAPRSRWVRRLWVGSPADTASTLPAASLAASGRRRNTSFRTVAARSAPRYRSMSARRKTRPRPLAARRDGGDRYRGSSRQESVRPVDPLASCRAPAAHSQPPGGCSNPRGSGPHARGAPTLHPCDRHSPSTSLRRRAVRPLPWPNDPCVPAPRRARRRGAERSPRRGVESPAASAAASQSGRARRARRRPPRASR